MESFSLDVLGGVHGFRSQLERFRFEPHAHDEVVVAVYVSGGKRFRCHHTEGELKAGDMLLMAPGAAHSATANTSGCEYVSLYVAEAQWRSLEIGSLSSACAIMRRDTGGLAAGRELVAALAEPNSSLQQAAIIAALSNLETGASARETRPATSAAVAWCKEQLLDDPLADYSLESFAARAEMSGAQFCRSFKAAYGLSVFQYQRSLRCAHARSLIRAGAPLAEAAAASGFADQSHMTRWFRRLFGVTPSRYVRQ